MTINQTTIALAAVALLLAGCGEKKKEDVIITEKMVQKAPAQPVRMQDYTQTKTVEWLGKEYRCEVERSADDSLAMVKDENGQKYYDGGLASPICVSRAFKDGCDKAVIILTQTEGFVKKCGMGNVLMSGIIKSRFPNMEKALLIRHKIYNRQLEVCRELEKRGKALIFRPSAKLVSFQSDISELEHYWEMGYKAGCENAEKIIDFMGEKQKA